MELSYFYDQINESDDFKSIFSLVDKNLESLVSDIQEVVNEASNPDDEPKKYNKTIVLRLSDYNDYVAFATDYNVYY